MRFLNKLFLLKQFLQKFSKKILQKLLKEFSWNSQGILPGITQRISSGMCPEIPRESIFIWNSGNSPSSSLAVSQEISPWILLEISQEISQIFFQKKNMFSKKSESGNCGNFPSSFLAVPQEISPWILIEISQAISQEIFPKNPQKVPTVIFQVIYPFFTFFNAFPQGLLNEFPLKFSRNVSWSYSKHFSGISPGFFENILLVSQKSFYEIQEIHP